MFHNSCPAPYETLKLLTIFTCILHDPTLFHGKVILTSFWIHSAALSVHEILIPISPAQFTDNGLGRLAQVRWILQHPVQNLGVNLLRLWAWKGRAEREMKREEWCSPWKLVQSAAVGQPESVTANTELCRCQSYFPAAICWLTSAHSFTRHTLVTVSWHALFLSLHNTLFIQAYQMIACVLVLPPHQ